MSASSHTAPPPHASGTASGRDVLSGGFQADLARFGPGSTERLTAEQAAEYCQSLATGHYENFPVLSVAVPRPLRPHFAAVYAFCRWADDLGDEVAGAEESLQLLAWWREELAACYAGQPRHPVFVALAPTIREFEIPMEPFADLISAFEQDQRVTEYETFDQLRDYCRRSADPVGRLVLHLARRHTPENVELSDSICTGLQLINFWQDVARDYAIGRVYLPREDLRRFGVSIEVIAQGVSTPEFLALEQFEVERARQWLRAGGPLPANMPGRLQVVIELFLRGGLRIAERIEAAGFRVLEQRPKVTKLDGARLLVRSAGAAVLRALVPGRSRSGRSPGRESDISPPDAVSSGPEVSS